MAEGGELVLSVDIDPYGYLAKVAGTALLLGDGLCGVYNPPIRLYGELSIFRIAPFLHSSYLPLIISYTHSLLTYVALILS